MTRPERWHHDCTDPQLSLIAPGGFAYENLLRQVIAPATDLNAELADVTLGQMGMWRVGAPSSSPWPARRPGRSS